MRVSVFLVIASTSLAGGCAAIVGGLSQEVTVETHQNRQSVAGARCELVNGKGTYEVITPGSVTIRRDFADLSITCQKPGMPAGTANVISSTKGLVFGNLLIGGLVGAAIDTSTGAAYDYPDLVRVGMGTNTIINGRTGADDDNLPSSTSAAAPGAPAPGAAPAFATSTANKPANSVVAAQPAAAAVQKSVSMDDLRMLLPAR